MRDGRPGFFFLGLYTLSLIAVLAPYYNWVYRLVVTFAHNVLFFTSLYLVIWASLRYAYRRRYREILLAAMLGSWVFFTGGQVNDWRYSITDKYIEDAYCRMDAPAYDGPILGGIDEIKVDGLERAGAFQNTSHCFFVICEEEFFYCDSPSRRLEP